MAKVVGEVIIDIEKCKGCELCVDACPHETLAMSDTINAKGYQYAVQIKNNCTGCMDCALVCPDAAITVYRGKPGNVKKSKNVTEKISN
jgi:2-oxoglutarate ferredoxin oxidoreductase subunit delta